MPKLPGAASFESAPGPRTSGAGAAQKSVGSTTLHTSMYCSVAEPVEFSSAPVQTPRKKVISSGSNSKTGQKNPHKNIMHITKNQFILTLFSMYSRFAQRNKMAFRIMKCTHKILSFLRSFLNFLLLILVLKQICRSLIPFTRVPEGSGSATLRILFLLLGSQTVN